MNTGETAMTDDPVARLKAGLDADEARRGRPHRWPVSTGRTAPNHGDGTRMCDRPADRHLQ